MSDISKLPKWAQIIIEGQKREITDLEEVVAAFEGTQKFERVAATVQPVWPGPFIPVAGDYRPEVLFLLEGQDPENPRSGKYVEVRLTTKGELEVRTDGQLVVRPSGGINRLTVDVETR